MIHSAVPGRYCGILVAIASILVGLSDFACAFSGAPLLPFASSGSRLGRSSTVAVFSSTLDLGTEAVEAASAGALAASKDRAVTLLDSALKRDEAAATTIIEEIQLLRSTPMTRAHANGPGLVVLGVAHTNGHTPFFVRGRPKKSVIGSIFGPAREAAHRRRQTTIF